MKYYILFVLAFLLCGPLVAQNEKDKVIFQAMQDEMNRNKSELALPGYPKPFYLSYAVGMSRQFEVEGVLGSVTSSLYFPERSIGSVQVLQGDYNNNSDSRYVGQFSRVSMPAEANYNLIRQNLWLGTDAVYKSSLQEMAAKAASLRANPLPEEEAALADLTPASAITKVIEHKVPYVVEVNELEELVRELSAIFKDYKELFNSRVAISGLDMDVYKATTENVVFKQPVHYVNLVAQATVRTDEGVRISDSYSLMLARPQDLPAKEELKKNIKAFADGLMALKNAPQVEEFYSGPVLFEDGASLAIFSGTLLSQSGLFAYRKPLSAQPLAQAVRALDGRLGKKIIDNRISVKNYTTLDKYNGTTLLGAYELDAEGVVPEKEMLLVEKGILRGFLNGRVPALKTTRSTGSSRFIMTNSDIAYVTAPGTIHIEVEKGLKPDKMKKALIKAAKEEGLDYGYIVRKVAGTASLIFKVSVKDGSETQVRFGDLSAINLAKVKRVLELSAKESVSNYLLNRQVLSSLIYPSSVLIEDVEISQTSVKPEKAPVLQFPLQRD